MNRLPDGDIPADLSNALLNELTFECDQGVLRPIACEILPGTLHHDFDAYAAMEKIDYALGREVWGTVILIDVTGRPGCPYRFKVLHECEAPIYYDCPRHILDLLPQTEDEWALSWRASCRERLAEASVLNDPTRGNIVNLRSARIRKRGC